jgi:hypothetical protein
LSEEWSKAHLQPVRADSEVTECPSGKDAGSFIHVPLVGGDWDCLEEREHDFWEEGLCDDDLEDTILKEIEEVLVIS